MEGQEATQQKEEGETLDVRMGEDEGVIVSVSHANLTEHIHPQSSKGTAKRIRFVGSKGEAKKLNEMVVNDITNKLEPWPAVLKPERVVICLGLSKQPKENGSRLVQAKMGPVNTFIRPHCFSYPPRVSSGSEAVTRIGQHGSDNADRTTGNAPVRPK